jgi:hypothetical protein
MQYPGIEIKIYRKCSYDRVSKIKYQQCGRMINEQTGIDPVKTSRVMLRCFLYYTV